MEFDDWQVKLARDALNLHRATARKENGKSLSWFDIAYEISAEWDDSELAKEYPQRHEGVRFGGEALRRFCTGSSPLNPMNRAALYQYLTNPERNLVSPGEFEGRSLNFHTAQRLLDFLAQDFDTERIAVPDSLVGKYTRSQSRADPNFNPDIDLKTEIAFDEPSDDGIIKVTLTETCQYGSGVPEVLSKGKPERVTHYLGWGVLTPEDYLLVFLKKKRNGQNRYFWALYADINHGQAQPGNMVALYEHTSPVTMEGRAFESGNVASDVQTELNNALSYYMRG